MAHHDYQGRYVRSDPTSAEAWFHVFEQSIAERLHSDRIGEARSLAFEWAEGAGSSLRLPPWRGWKEFKRAVAAKWFGEPERSVFGPGWRVNDVIDYASQFTGRHVRASVFPDGIACHARSLRLPRGTARQRKALAQLDPNVVLEVFPESSSSTSICFRRQSDAFGSEVVFEAGLGQAMAVFESEQGKHPFVCLTLRANDGSASWKQGGDKDDEASMVVIGERLQGLVARHAWQLQAHACGICHGLGIDWLSIEGYYDEGENPRLTVVDLDLPFDTVFMGHAG